MYKLNYKLDEPNLNGRIYKKDIFIKMIDEAIIDKLYLCYKSIEYPNFFVDLETIIGIVRGYEIKDDNSVYFDIDILNTKYSNLFNNTKEVTTASLGKIDTDFIVDNDCKLICLYLIK